MFTVEEIQRKISLDVDIDVQFIADILNYTANFEPIWSMVKLYQINTDNLTGIQIMLEVLNKVIGGYGVETIYTASGVHPIADYIHFQDSNQLTILYDLTTYQFLITSLGDWCEDYKRGLADLQFIR